MKTAEEVQKEYAKQTTNQEALGVKIISIKRQTDDVIFKVGDTVKFSDRYNPFVLEEITFNTNERRIELNGDGLFCSLIESDCSITSPQS